MEKEEDCHPSSKERDDGGKVILVILVGAPGSGKTTFCDHVMKSARRPWLRVCQDTIANGKAGTRSQCLSSGSVALKNGKSVFIDRCNLEREQRAEFVKLGGPDVDIQAVVLDLPARLCISRSVQRIGHEGNLQGGKAAAVVNRMLQKKELPKLNEGFSRITFCQNENDVQGAINMYSALGPSDNLPSGCFGQKNADEKVQLGIMKFFKKVDVPDKSVCDPNRSENPISKQDTKIDFSYSEHENSSMPVKDADKNVMKGKNMMGGSLDAEHTVNDLHTLAFPSISTSDFQFNHDKASDIIVETVLEFLNKVENVRLILVDLVHGSHMLSLVRVKASQKNIDSKRFFTVAGDITRLYTESGLRCNAIANAANWRLRPGGGGVNAAIFSAGGQDLEIATKERAETLSPGSSVVVPLPLESPLYEREGVTHVIHVLGPNMNPQRPNYLKNDYIKGCKILHEAYSSLFESFASIIRTRSIQKEKQWNCKSSDLHDPVDSSCNNQCRNVDQKLKRGDCFESERNKKYRGLPFGTALDDSECRHSGSPSVTSELYEQKNEKVNEGARRVGQSWAQGLYHIAMHPEQHENNILEISDNVVVLHDLYPKAKKHILVLSRLNGLNRLSDVQKEQVWLLRIMHSVGLRWVERFLSEDASLIFRLGYHSVPSMRQLHLHVISQDFNSPHLKNKKHWNSFTTAFFRDSTDVIDEVEKFGNAKLNDDDKLLSMELRCHRCRSAHPNIPRLKAHISNCRAQFPATLLDRGHLFSAPLREMSEA